MKYKLYVEHKGVFFGGRHILTWYKKTLIRYKLHTKDKGCVVRGGHILIWHTTFFGINQSYLVVVIPTC